MKKSELKNYIRENIISTLSEDTEAEIEKTKELTSAIKDLESAKKEAGIEENGVKEEIPNTTMLRINNVVKSAPTAAKAMVDFYNQMAEKEQTDFLKNAKFKIAMDKLKDLAGDEEEAGIEEANIGLADLEEMGYDAGEKAFDMHFDKSILNNTPDTRAYSKGFVQAIIDSAGSLRLEEASYSNQYVDKNRIASNKYKQANDYKASYDSLAQVASEKQFDDDNIDKKAVKGAKKNKGLAKAAEELALLTREMKSLAKKYSKAEGEEKEKLVADLKKKTKLKKELEAIIDK